MNPWIHKIYRSGSIKNCMDLHHWFVGLCSLGKGIQIAHLVLARQPRYTFDTYTMDMKHIYTGTDTLMCRPSTTPTKPLLLVVRFE